MEFNYFELKLLLEATIKDGNLFDERILERIIFFAKSMRTIRNREKIDETKKSFERSKKILKKLEYPSK